MKAVSVCFKEKTTCLVPRGALQQPRKRGKVVEIVLRSKAQAEHKETSSAFQAGLIVQYRVKARKLARSILRKWHARLDLEEVDSLVDLSLCEAARRFNSRKGASFMTFLYYHLRGNLIRTIHYSATVNAIPTGEAYDSESFEEGNDKNQRVCSANEVADALCSTEYISPDDLLYKKELVSLSHAACSRLDNLEREVIERIYLKGQQLMDIARSLGYSRCHISRVKRKALETLYDDLTADMSVDEKPSKPAFKDEDILVRRVSQRARAQRRKIDVHSNVVQRVHAI